MNDNREETKSFLDPFLRPSKPLSQRRQSIYKRTRALQDPAHREHLAEYSRKRSASKRNSKLKTEASVRHQITRRNGYLEKRVRFHLSKGRTAADVVVRENALMSDVLEIINRISNEPTT